MFIQTKYGILVSVISATVLLLLVVCFVIAAIAIAFACKRKRSYTIFLKADKEDVGLSSMAFSNQVTLDNATCPAEQVHDF